MTCFCGCGERAVHLHHCVTAAYIVRAADTRAEAKTLLKDERNLVPVAFRCHGNHHARSKKYELGMLPDSVFEFGRELLGAGPAHGFLTRAYAGTDPRLDALEAEWEQAA